MRDVVCLSTQYWDGPHFRKHQFMERFARSGSQVLYVEPTHSLLRSTNYLGEEGNPVLRSSVRTIEPGLSVMRPRRALPKPNAPGVSRANRILMASTVNRVARNAGVSGIPIAWVYDVEWEPALDALLTGTVVLDLVDDLVDYEKDPARQAYVGRCIERLVDRAGLVVFTSEPLRARFGGLCNEVVITNGFDERLFNSDVVASRPWGSSGRVIGFVGTLFRYIDYAALEAIALAFPEDVVVLVGREEGVHEGLERLRSHPNVVIAGPVAPNDVPSLVAGFDVCLSPFARGRVADSVSPLKLYEYLALGRPVVCSSLDGVMADTIAPLIRFADHPEEWVSATRAALDNRSLPPGWERIVQCRSWSALFDDLARALENAEIA